MLAQSNSSQRPACTKAINVDSWWWRDAANPMLFCHRHFSKFADKSPCWCLCGPFCRIDSELNSSSSRNIFTLYYRRYTMYLALGTGRRISCQLLTCFCCTFVFRVFLFDVCHFYAIKMMTDDDDDDEMMMIIDRYSPDFYSSQTRERFLTWYLSGF